METFHLTMLDEKKIHYSGKALSCIIATPSGKIGFMARHENFIGVLSPSSEIHIADGNGAETTIKADWGVLMFKDNNCLITLARE